MTTIGKIDHFMRRCREKGLSITPQRLAIYKALADNSTHPNPESIYKKIIVDNPTISFATVYKTLETFEKMGIINQVTSLHQTVRYDPETRPHHHMVCIKCQKIIDVFDETINQLTVPEEVSSKYQCIDYNIQYNIICDDCREQ